MRRECLERFPYHRGLKQQSQHVSSHVRDARAVMHARIANWRFPLKSVAAEGSRHSRHMCNPQFYVSGKRHMRKLCVIYKNWKMLNFGKALNPGKPHGSKFRRNWRQRRLSLRRTPVPPVAIKLTLWQHLDRQPLVQQLTKLTALSFQRSTRTDLRRSP